MSPKKQSPKPISLNEEQQAVVGCREGYYQVLAGPGAGKSHCLSTRYAELVKEGLDPSDIISLSFTATAAKNLRDRVEAQVGKLITNRTAGAVTFHSLALSMAQEERDAYPFTLAEFPLCAEPQANTFSAQAGKRHDVDPRSLRTATSLWKRRRISPSQAIRDSEAKLDPKQLKLALAYKSYDKLCSEAGLLDFDSLIYYAVQIMDKSAEVRSRWKRNWLQLDESQDMSKIEWDLAKLISGRSVLAVGDISQGIYSFRGSDGRLFANMEQMFPGTKTLFLSTNYRSSPEIIDFIRPIAASRELAEKFHTSNPSSGVQPEVRGFLSGLDEANWVVSRIKHEQTEE